MDDPDDDCDDYIAEAGDQMGSIDIYDIYTDVCITSQNDKLIHQLARAGSKFHQILDEKSQARKRNEVYPPYYPCADTYTNTYLNTPSVQAAIHVAFPNYTWNGCSDVLNYNYSDVEKSVIPLYEVFLQNNINVLIYSGDVDAIVPVTGSRIWIAELQRPVIQSWTPYMLDNQVNGYFVQYKGLTFATVRNAGHMVPQTQPARAQNMFSKFLYSIPF